MAFTVTLLCTLIHHVYFGSRNLTGVGHYYAQTLPLSLGLSCLKRFAPQGYFNQTAASGCLASLWFAFKELWSITRFVLSDRHLLIEHPVMSTVNELSVEPSGGTWFDAMRRSFADVPINTENNGIATTEFLEAAESMTTIFGTISTNRILGIYGL